MSGPLSQPLWWFSLAVLLLNDHVLKSAGVLPGWFTGKLSDFAGLVMAPVLFSFLLQRVRGGRAIAFAAIATIFSAIKLSPVAARSLEATVAAVGVRWRITVDPTDLIALSVLPLAWWLAGREIVGTHARTWERPLRMSGTVLGLFACIATSIPRPLQVSSHAFVVNDTAQGVDLIVRTLPYSVDCAIGEEQLPMLLTREAFTSQGVLYHMEPGEAVALDDAGGVSETGTTSTVSEGGASTTFYGSVCQALLLQLDGGPPQALFWRDLPWTSWQEGKAPAATAIEGQIRVTISETNTNLDLTPSDSFFEADLSAVDNGVACRGIGRSLLEVSLPFEDVFVLDSVEPTPDGCLHLRAQDLDGYVCIPAEFFPFVAGDQVLISHVEDGPTLTGTHEGSLVALEIHHDATLRSSAVTTVAACEGAQRLTDGGVVTPLAVIGLGDRDTVLLPGDVGMRGQSQLFLGRAERVWTDPANDRGGAEDAISNRVVVDYLVLTGGAQ